MKFLPFKNSNKCNEKMHPKLRKKFYTHEMLVQKFMSACIPNQSVTAFKDCLGENNIFWQNGLDLEYIFSPLQLCESQSGYIWNSIINTSKGTYLKWEYKNYGLSMKCVLSPIHNLKNKRYLLTTDNFYTSPKVDEILLGYDTDVIGTVTENRKELPAEFKKIKLKKGEIKVFQKDKIIAL